MLLTLIRHGETIWNALKKVQGQIDIALNDEGIAQAIELAKSLDQTIEEYSAIYCSALQRAIKTAEIVHGKHQKIPIIQDARLNSRNLGDYAGRTIEDIKAEDPENFQKWRSGDPTFRPPKGESTEEMIIRTHQFLDHLKTSYSPNAKIFIVSHRENIGGFFRILNVAQSGIDPLNAIKNCTPYDCFL